MKKTLYVVIGCDTDPDRASFVKEPIEEARSWRGMLEGIPRAKKRLKELVDANGRPPIFTWCLRVDHQMRFLYGSYAHVLETHKDFLLELERSGDELAWHPHFWNYDAHLKKWYQEITDVDWQVRMLEEAYAAYTSVLPGRAKSVRMGWDYHNNRTIATLAALGIPVDFSGIPGLRITPKNKFIRGENFFDWRITPNQPYVPSAIDYRRPARKGEASLSLIEAPNFVSKSLGWSVVAGLVLAKKMKDPLQLLSALARPTYWIGITGKPVFFAPIIAQLERAFKEKDAIIFVNYFHPDELLENDQTLYSLDYMVNNIRYLIEVMKDLDVALKFIKACDIPKVAQSHI
jgi:hypothetical protein